MRLWPHSLLGRLSLVVLAGLLLANSLSLSLVMIERTSSVRNVMLGNLEYDVATSVAILDRLPAAERAAWLPKLARGNYRYLLGPGEAGVPPEDRRSRDAIRSLTATLGHLYPLHFTAVPGPVSHIQAHITLHDGAPLTLDLIPHMPPVASWLPVVLIFQLVLMLLCAWLAVRMVIRPFTRFTRAVDGLQPAASEAHFLPEQGPYEVQQAARAFNAMQDRIQGHLKERAQILAAISHDLQTPITRMKLRVEMAGDTLPGEKLMQDLDTMTQLVREGIAYARSSDRLEEPRLRISLPTFLDSLACDYADVGHAVQFHTEVPVLTISTRPQALRRVMSNLLDNALKYGGDATLSLTQPTAQEVLIAVCDNGQGIPESELEAVLQPFYRIENSRNRTTGGTGLGLAIAAQLVAQLGGRLTLANRPEGGLRVCVTLPTA
ncbi:ATP-binding protein [Enterobacteriaceae bacterium C34A]